jgi:hypothetical protein
MFIWISIYDLSPNLIFDKIYTVDEKEIIDFVNDFGVNSKDFPFIQYIEAARKDVPQMVVSDKPSIAEIEK